MEFFEVFEPDCEFLPGETMGSHLQDLHDLCKWLGRYNINTSNSRIAYYIKFLKSFINMSDFSPRVNEEDRAVFDELLYVLREIHELSWILDGLKQSAPEGVEELLKVVIGGKSFARDDIKTTARNYQLELRIASYFLQSSCVVQLNQITDIVVESPKYRFFVECKRLSSRKKVNSRVREAAKQLNIRLKHKKLKQEFGVAVFDVTKIAFPHQGLTWGVNNEHGKTVIQEKLQSIWREFDFDIPFKNNKKVILIWLQIHIPSLIISTGQPTTRFSSFFYHSSSMKGKGNSALRELMQHIESSSNFEITQEEFPR
jgi:hypothetical protein